MKKIEKQSAITFVELPATQFGVLNGEPACDFYSAIKLPSRAIPVLAAVLKADGWTDVEEVNPLYHGIKGKLSARNFSRIFKSDALLISSITRTSLQSMELADLYRSKNPDGIVIAGGPDPTFRVADWLEHVDIVVRGEGEITIRELMEELTKERQDLRTIDGISFKENGVIVETKDRKLMTPEQLSAVPHPYYDDVIKKKVASMVVESSRGCPNNCDFCSVTRLYGRAYRQKSKEYVTTELEEIEKIGSYSFFTDDNIAANQNETIGLLNEIRKRSTKKNKIAQITIAAAFNENLLKALKRAGFLYLCVGIESIVDKTLEFFGKPYRADRIKEAIRIYRKHGFWIHGMMIIGGDGDTKETIEETQEWIGKNLDSVQLFTPIPIPGTRFYDRMEQEGRILTKNWYLYDGQHVVIRPKNFTPYWLQKKIYRMYKEFYSLKNGFLRNFGSRKMGRSMLFSFYANFMAKEFFKNPQLDAHLEFLRSVG
jgi:radical SAM superfamily enzyme YgiQ (UPF0313 family)